MSDLITINTNGLEEAIRCAICENQIKSDRGCDGSCRYDVKLFERIVQAIKDNEVQRPHGEWILDAVSPCSISWFRCSYCGYKYEASAQHIAYLANRTITVMNRFLYIQGADNLSDLDKATLLKAISEYLAKKAWLIMKEGGEK